VTIKAELREVNNAVLDLQSADYNTFERPITRLAFVLNEGELRPITDKLKSKVNFDIFLESANEGGSFMGSARLNWPTAREAELGLTIQLIERAAENPHWFVGLAHKYYYSGRKIIGDIRKITSAVIVPFNRDFATYVNELLPDFPDIADDPRPASAVTYNIGTMHNSPLQHVSTGGHGVQSTSYSVEQLHSIVALYRLHVENLDLDVAMRRRADAQVATIEAQLSDEPDPTIVAAAGRSLKTIIEGAIGGAAGTALASAPIWAPLLSMFN
jgi:hypothetical protein